MRTGVLHLVQLHQLGSGHPFSRPGIPHHAHARGDIRRFREVPLGARIMISRPGGPVARPYGVKPVRQDWNHTIRAQPDQAAECNKRGVRQ